MAKIMTLREARNMAGVSQFDLSMMAFQQGTRVRPEVLSDFERRRFIPTLTEIGALEKVLSGVLNQEVILEERRMVELLIREGFLKEEGGVKLMDERKEQSTLMRKVTESLKKSKSGKERDKDDDSQLNPLERRIKDASSKSKRS